MGGIGAFLRPHAALFLILAAVAACKSPSLKSHPPVREARPLKDINQTLARHQAALMELKGVAGVYAGARDDGSPCIRVMVEKRDTTLERKIPSALEGFPVEIEETGPMEPMKKE